MIGNLVAGVIGLSTLNYIEEVLSDSPVGFWMLDDLSGSVMDDRSTNNNDGTYFNAPTLNQAGPGGISKSVFFQGSSSQLANTSLVSALNFAPNSNWSIECWYKDNTTAGTTIEGVYAVRSDSGVNDYPVVVVINNTVAGRIQAFVSDSGGGAITLQYDLTPDTNWHQIVVTATSGGAVRLYVDSVERASSTTARITTSANRRAIMGANWSGSAFQFGTLNVAACSAYTSTLSTARITNHYDKGK
jgi:hypothetical protein